MFFTQELLERRESGFGLLWLAATLGAKSSFKKLPKRSVLTADISQLCGLIAEPAEPLALRLSSNLMIGVARVYKVKQEIFMTDVTTCFNSLRKAVQEMRTSDLAELQMAQPSMRPDTLTLVADPGTLFAIDFGDIFGSWDDATQRGRDVDREESDDEFDPAAKSKKKQKAKSKPPSLTENVRANLHTLDENLDLLLLGSLDASFDGLGFGGVVPSSSQVDGGFGFNDDIFGLPDGIEIGDELARELGEGWGASAVNQDRDTSMSELSRREIENVFEQDFQFPEDAMHQVADDQHATGQREGAPEGSIIVPLLPLSPVHDGDPSLHINAPNGYADMAQNSVPQRKTKRVRLLLDARTELTDDELKAARANYLEGQESLRREMVRKKFEKDSGKLIEEMIWGVPRGLHAPVLVDFWTENFKLQVEARAGALHVETHGQPPTKRRRINDAVDDGDGLEYGDMMREPGGGDLGMPGEEGDMGFMMERTDFATPHNMADGRNWELDSRQRSSEDPGQARNASRPPSAFGSQFDILRPVHDTVSSSQRSALFPWDNAGASSSVNGTTFDYGRDSSAKRSFGRADTRLRGSSIGSRRESPLNPSRFAESPADFGIQDLQIGEGFHFDVPGEESVLVEAQQPDSQISVLERNSNNFLEYAKMQLQTFPSATSMLTFDDVVPKLTSTSHVAAAAFYHCLVLATKDLVALAQDEPYGLLQITVK